MALSEKISTHKVFSLVLLNGCQNGHLNRSLTGRLNRRLNGRLNQFIAHLNARLNCHLNDPYMASSMTTSIAHSKFRWRRWGFSLTGLRKLDPRSAPH